MGGDNYDGDVAERSRADTGREHFVHTAAMLAVPEEERKCHNSLNPMGVDRECCDCAEHPKTTPIAIVMDVTRSRGEDAKDIYGKMPMMIGQIILNGYATHPEILFMGAGDANSDIAPVQVGQYESDNRLDQVLANLWLEKGGGGTGQETYELNAYFLARHTKLDCLNRGAKAKAFFLVDEGFYPKVDKGHVKRLFGDKLTADIPSAQIFAELQEKYDVYVIFPRSTWQDRKKDIDEEISQRVRAAGGMVEGVDVRFSLIWHNRNDLDLHVQGPDGHHIYYGSKRSPTGGFLDVDMNVQGETTKPVENTRWAKSKAPKGSYKVWVENYGFHEQSEAGTDFKVEIEVNGEVQHFEGKTTRGRTGTESAVEVGTFMFDPTKRAEAPDEKEKYAGYDEEKIKAQWATVVPPENILMIDHAKAAVDIILGVLAITGGSRTLDTYLADMRARSQTPERVEEVKRSLADLGERASATKVDAAAIPAPKKRLAKSKSVSKRI